MSCIWEIHHTTFKVRRCWYGRTVIRSQYKLCYEHAQDIINGSNEAEMKKKMKDQKFSTPLIELIFIESCFF